MLKFAANVSASAGGTGTAGSVAAVGGGTGSIAAPPGPTAPTGPATPSFTSPKGTGTSFGKPWRNMAAHVQSLAPNPRSPNINFKDTQGGMGPGGGRAGSPVVNTIRQRSPLLAPKQMP